MRPARPHIRSPVHRPLQSDHNGEWISSETIRGEAPDAQQIRAILRSKYPIPGGHSVDASTEEDRGHRCETNRSGSPFTVLTSSLSEQPSLRLSLPVWARQV